MFHQVGSLGENYNNWVHNPVDRPLRLFHSDIMEFFSKCTWKVIPIFWLPISAFLFWTGHQVATQTDGIDTDEGALANRAHKRIIDPIYFMDSDSKSFFKQSQFGPSAFASTPPMPPTKHTSEILVKFVNNSTITHKAIHWSLSFCAYLHYGKHQGVFEVFVGDSPWSGVTPPTPIPMCDHNILESGPRFENRGVMGQS